MCDDADNARTLNEVRKAGARTVNKAKARDAAARTASIASRYNRMLKAGWGIKQAVATLADQFNVSERTIHYAVKNTR